MSFLEPFKNTYATRDDSSFFTDKKYYVVESSTIIVVFEETIVPNYKINVIGTSISISGLNIDIKDICLQQAHLESVSTGFIHVKKSFISFEILSSVH